MEITEIKVFPVQEEKLKAFVSVVFDRCFMVNDIKIIQGRQGLFISMPSRKKKNGEFKDVAHPLNNDTRQMIEGQVLTEYDRVLEERAAGGAPQTRRAPKRRSAARKPKTPEAAKASPGAKPETHDEAKEDAAKTSGTRDETKAAAESGETGGKESECREAKGTEAERKKTDGKEPEREKTRGESDSEEESGEKTLEEIEEMHLRDSFWSVP